MTGTPQKGDYELLAAGQSRIQKPTQYKPISGANRGRDYRSQKRPQLGIYGLDTVATRAAVEKYLLQAREYKVTEYIPGEPSVTASYSDMPRSNTGQTSNQTARLAERNVDEPERRRRHADRAERAISRLGIRHQRLIRIRYMEDDDVMDSDVAAELGYSDRHYRRIKSVAIYRLASLLGLEVFFEN